MKRDQLLSLIEGISEGIIPVRASSMNDLDCPWKWLLGVANDGSSGIAAQTGTLAHKGIEMWIENGGDLDEAIVVMEALQEAFRSANEVEGKLGSAKQWVKRYTQDPRNAPLDVAPGDEEFGTVIAVEEKFKSKLTTPKGRTLQVWGTTDQIRLADSHPHPMVWDAKCGALTKGLQPENWAYKYVRQLCTYATLAADRFDRPHGVGGVIHPPSYTSRTGNKEPFIPLFLSPDAVKVIVDSMLTSLDRILDGFVYVEPGAPCVFCYEANGPADCIPRLQKASEEPKPDAPVGVSFLK